VCRWNDNIKLDFQEVGLDMDWIDLLRIGTGSGLL
jgi:hypothetical protein